MKVIGAARAASSKGETGRMQQGILLLLVLSLLAPIFHSHQLVHEDQAGHCCSETEPDAHESEVASLRGEQTEGHGGPDCDESCRICSERGAFISAAYRAPGCLGLAPSSLLELGPSALGPLALVIGSVQARAPPLS